MDGTKEAGHPDPPPGLSFRDYFDGLAHDQARAARPLLERLEQVAEQSGYARARYLFTASASEIFASGRVSADSPRHFFLVTRVALEPFLVELARVSEAEWGRNARHQLSVQRETRSIELSVQAAGNVSGRHNQYVVPNGMYSARFPYLMNWLQAFAMATGNGTLQLARVVRLEARGQVYRHRDRGLYYLIRDRYHLVLRSRSGSRMQCEDQFCTWRPGELWWFNNHVQHQAFNDSDDERIHVIFDVLPHRNQVFVPYFQLYAEKFSEAARVSGTKWPGSDARGQPGAGPGGRDTRPGGRS
jgi:hypothetical protein